MNAAKSSTAKPRRPQSPAAQLAVKVMIAAVVIPAYVVVCWCYLYSVFRDGLGPRRPFAWPAEVIAAAQHGPPASQKQVWFSFALTVLVPCALGLALLIRPRKLYGDAKFGNEADVGRAELRQPWGNVLGLFRSRLLMAAPPGNVLGFAPPGGGKGVGWVIPTLLTWQGSVVALDPKKENWLKTAGFRAKYSKAGDTVMFDPLNYDGRGWRYNPLGQLGTGIRRIDEVARIANMLIPNPLTGDTYWASGARDLFMGAVLAYAELDDAYADSPNELREQALLKKTLERVSIGTVYRLVVDGGQCGERCAKLAQRVRGDLPRRLLGSFAALPTKQAEGVLGALKDKIGIWVNPAVDAATATSDFTFEDLRRRRRSIYLGVSPDNIERLAPLLGLMFQQAIDSLVRAMPGSDETVDVLFSIDEAAMLRRLPILAASLAFLRGYKGVVSMILQSPAQGEEHYGAAGWRAMVDCFKYRVLYAPNSLETATAISKELGTYTTRSVNKSRSAKGGASTSVSAARRELMLPQEVLQMGRDKLVLFVEGLRPILGKKFRYFEDPVMLARSEIPPPALPTYLIDGSAAVAAVDPSASISAAVEIQAAEALLVERVADEAVLEVALAALVSADENGDSDRVADLQLAAKEIAARLPNLPDGPAMLAVMATIGAQ